MSSDAYRHPLIWHIIAACALAFMLSAGLRLSEATRWAGSTHQVDGEYLLATHDAYAWAAGAEHEQMRTSQHPMARLLTVLASSSSASPANVAYWLPAILGALSAISITLWAFHMGSSKLIALAAGVFGSTAPAFFARTRLGYFDSDWATMFFPLLISLLLAVWLGPYLNTRAGGRSIGVCEWIVRSPALLIFIIPFGSIWHEFISAYSLTALWVALLLLSVFASPRQRGNSAVGLLASALAVGFGWTGAALGLLVLMLQWRVRRGSTQTRWGGQLLLAFVGVGLMLLTWIQFEGYLSGKISQYFRPSDDAAVSIAYPDLGQSVREVQDVEPIQALQGAAYHWILGAVGLVGFLLLLRRDWSVSFLIPLLLLGLTSPHTGARFTMYASPALMLALLVVIETLKDHVFREYPRWEARADFFLVVLLVGLLFLEQQSYTRLPVETVLSQEHAAGLKELASGEDGDGMVWTWWDYGYATQYYSGMQTFADGGRNSGEYLFTLGFVLSSEDQESSAGMMGYAASKAYRPWQSWKDWSPEELNTWLRGVGLEQASAPQEEHFLAVQWEAVALLEWIHAYGAWDFNRQVSDAHQPVYQFQPLELDLEKGIFTERSGNSFLLKSADIFSSGRTEHYAFAQNDGDLHLLLHSEDADVFLLGGDLYRSTLVQLLLGNASGEFEVVVNRAPELVIYRVR
jgi:dolichyl-diphosphooligosaccharide--protein glycosyltransferase